jgi:hypothetical protein
MFWDLKPYKLAEMDQRYTEDGDRRVLRNGGTFALIYMVPHPRRL